MTTGHERRQGVPGTRRAAKRQLEGESERDREQWREEGVLTKRPSFANVWARGCNRTLEQARGLLADTDVQERDELSRHTSLLERPRFAGRKRNPGQATQQQRRVRIPTPTLTDALACRVAAEVMQRPFDMWARSAWPTSTGRPALQGWVTLGCKSDECKKSGQCTCGASAQGVATSVPGANRKACRAMKGWLMSGGAPAVVREQRSEWLLQKQMKALRQAAAFHRYFASANHSCSGAALPQVEAHIRWTRTIQRKRGAEQDERVRRTNVRIRQGGVMDRERRFACSIWRVCFKRGRNGGRGALMALVRWKDSRYWPAWKRALKGNNLSAELREEARRLKGAWLRGAACRTGAARAGTPAAVQQGWRRSERRAAAAAAGPTDRTRATGSHSEQAALRGCDIDDDEDLTIDEWLALDSEVRLSNEDEQSELEEESGSSDEQADDDSSAAPEEDIYDAVRVCDVRRRGGRLQALVEWSGDNNGAPWDKTWEPVTGIGAALQQEASAIWERRKAGRRARGRRPRAEQTETSQQQLARARRASEIQRQREDRERRVGRSRESRGTGAGSGPTTRKRSRADGA